MESFSHNRRPIVLARSLVMHSPLTFAIFAIAACGDDAPPSVDAGSFDGNRADAGSALRDSDLVDSGSLVDSGAPVECAASGLTPGDEVFEIMFDGRMRTFRVHVPPSYDGSVAVPLVLDFHGYGSNATNQNDLSGINAKADEEGFIAIHPEGAGLVRSWNAGRCCGEAVTIRADDVGFARAMVGEVTSRACIDPRRVYATGMSNGGFMSHRLGCEAADLFAAIAPVAGALGIAADDCDPSRPVPVMHFHGTADVVVPYNGGGLTGAPSVADTMAVWVERDGCVGDATETFQMGNATCMSFTDCNAGVEVTTCTVEGFGHSWPGSPLGESSDIDATDAMWQFFERFAL